MLNNLSDYISLITLVFIAGYAVHFFVLSMLRKENDDDLSQSRRQLLKDYLNNEEE